MANIGTLTARLGLNTKGLQTGAAQARGTFTGLEKGAVGSMGAITASIGKMAAAFGVVMVGAKLIGAFKNMITLGADFEYTMATVGGVMRATGDEMKSLTAIAKKMGETTEWTASQSADALKFLGMAGFSAAKSVKALPGVLDLATAGNVDLGRAADIATNALTAMNLPVRELTRVNDVFIGTITRSNTNMEQMAEAFKYAAPVARAYGYSVEELSGLIGALGDAGIQGSLAGTALRRSFQEASKIAKEMGFESSDLVDVLQSLKDIGEEDTVIMERFGLRASAGIGAMLTRLPEIREFQNTLTGVGGEAARLADIMRTTVKGSFAELKSVVQSVAIDTFDRLASSIENTVQSIITWIRRNKDELVTLFEVMAKSALAVTTVMTKLVGIVADFTSTTREATDAVGKLSDSMIELETQSKANADATERHAESVAKILFFMNEVILTGPRLMDKLAQSTRRFGEALLGIATGGGPALVDEFTDTLKRLDEWLGKVRTGFERATKEQQAWRSTVLATARAYIKAYSGMGEETVEIVSEAEEKKVEIVKATSELREQVERDILDGMTEAHELAVAKFEIAEEKKVEGIKAAAEMRKQVERDILDGMTEAHELAVAKFEQAEEDKQQTAYETAQFIGQQMGNMVDAWVADLQGAQVDMERIFKQMALAFIRFFIEKAISAMAFQFVNPMLGLLMLFDKAANDRMAMQQGERFVGFFSQGAQNAMAQMNLAPAMAQMNLAPAMASAPVSGLTASALPAFESNVRGRSDIQVVLNVNAPITSDQFVDWIVHDMAPIIERASESGQTRIALDPFVQTGDSSGVIT